jgi:muramoyltetrapeptide carboxypeptidase
VKIVPPSLKPGGTIGVVSPGRWSNPEWITKAKSVLEGRGFNVVVPQQNYLQYGQLAGEVSARARSIMDAFSDPAIDAVMCARGGTGSIHILDQLDYKLIKANPKPFIGFSDITFPLLAMSECADIITYHGPLMWNLAHAHDPRVVDDLLKVLAGYKGLEMNYDQIEIIRPGVARGRLVGGNMTMLQHLIGTPYDWHSKGAILFIEDVDEVIYKVAQRLHQMKLAGKFVGVRAVVVGEMIDVKDGETGFAHAHERPYGKTLKEVFLEALPPDIPLCYHFPCGHGKNMTTFPIGAEAELDLHEHGAKLTYV